MDMLYKYKEAFSLKRWDRILSKYRGRNQCKRQVIIFIRPYHIREEDKKVMDKEMKCLHYLGILKEGYSLYLSPVMLNSWKVIQDKRVVTDFRHLDIRIVKNNLAYPSYRDTFSLLGNSKCEVLLVLDLKDAFHSLMLSENSKQYCGILPYFGSASYLYQRKSMGWTPLLQFGNCT